MSEPSRLASAAIFYHPDRPEAVELAARIDHALSQEGLRVKTAPAFDGHVEPMVSGFEIAVALGGDGTILAVSRDSAGSGVPTLGINLGRVGFLAEFTPEEFQAKLPRILARDFWIERRCVLEASWVENGENKHHLAMNEVALARGNGTRAIRVAVYINGSEYTVHTADGVMVATATGSTAYSLAAGGPILYPESTDLLLTPVAPHLNIGRSIILPSTASFHLELRETAEAMLAIDGRTEWRVQAGAQIGVKLSNREALFARFGSRTYFFSVVAERLH